MITNFNRVRTQLFVEKRIGCPSVDSIKQYTDSFSSYNLASSDVDPIKQLALKDGTDFYFKGFLSLAQALLDIDHGLHSWAVPKLYYSLFYFIRSSFCFHDYSIIRTYQRIFVLKLRANEKLEKYNQGKQTGDHKLTFVAWRKIIGPGKDILLDNSVDDIETYVWMMRAREMIQYKQRSFEEPSLSAFFQNYNEKSLGEWIDIYLNDDVPVFCFNSEHACLAIPLKRAMLSHQDMLGRHKDMTNAQKLVLKTLLGSLVKERSTLRSIFD